MGERHWWNSEAFWFGFWEMLALRPLIDPKGHQQRFLELLKRQRGRLALSRKEQG